METISNEDLEVSEGIDKKALANDGYTLLSSSIVKLEVGGCLEGILTGIEETPKSPILHFDTSKGLASIWANAQLEELILPRYVGMTFRIHYKGLHDLKDGKRIHMYEVACKPEDGKEAPTRPSKNEIDHIRTARESRKAKEDNGKSNSKKSNPRGKKKRRSASPAKTK